MDVFFLREVIQVQGILANICSLNIFFHSTNILNK